jgi:hypothetical protein
MKKILISIMFLFVLVICYAAPPPDVPVNLAPDVGCQVNADVNATVTPVIYEAQKVAYIYRGNTVGISKALMIAELCKETEFPPMPVLTFNYNTYNLHDDLPPPLRASYVVTYNYNRDLQFSNYGYPLSMN